MIPIPEIDAIEVVFATRALEILPPMAKIPEEFKRSNNKWVKVFSDWFFRGLKNCQWKPKAGVDTTKALKVISACMGDFGPSHEHKEAGVAYLLSEWFEDVTYKLAKERP